MEPKKKELLKKGIVFTGFFVIFLGVLYLIFKPSLESDEAGKGMNTEFPDAEQKDLPDKLDDYKMSSLSEGNGLSAVSDEISAINESDTIAPSALEPSTDDHPAVEEVREARRLQSIFYEGGMSAKMEKEYQDVIADLQEQLKEERQKRNTPATTTSDAYERMMEKSIEMMNRQMEKDRPKPQPSVIEEGPELEEYRAEKPQKQFVSQMGIGPIAVENTFNTVSLSGITKENSNTIRVVVDQTTTVKQGDFLKLRLMETVRFGSLTMPKGSTVTAKAQIDERRMKLLVTSVENRGQIVAVKLTAFDTDAQEGVNIPTTVEREAITEAGSEVAGNVGQSFTFAQGATDQVISEAARTLMQGGARYMQKKIALPRVTIKAGYRLYLIESK